MSEIMPEDNIVDLEIKKLQVTVSQMIPGHLGALRESAKLVRFQPADMDAMVYRLLTFVNQTDKTIERRIQKFPDSPLDSFRLKYLPTFFARCFPIKYKEVEILTKIVFLCPHVYFGREDEPIVHVKFLSQGDNK